MLSPPWPSILQGLWWFGLRFVFTQNCAVISMSFGWNLCNFGIMCYICTFGRQDQGWISMWTQCHTMDFNVDTCKVSIQFPARISPELCSGDQWWKIWETIILDVHNHDSPATIFLRYTSNRFRLSIVQLPYLWN